MGPKRVKIGDYASSISTPASKRTAERPASTGTPKLKEALPVVFALGAEPDEPFALPALPTPAEVDELFAAGSVRSSVVQAVPFAAVRSRYATVPLEVICKSSVVEAA